MPKHIKAAKLASTVATIKPVAKPATVAKPVARKPAIKPLTGKPAKPATVAATIKPVVLGAAAAKQAASGKSNVAKPAKPAAADAAPVAKPSGNVTRTARTIAAQATNFGGLSDRDNAYLAFFAGFAKRTGGRVAIADVHASGLLPDYSGSRKPHDAGVIVRLTKAGLVSPASDGTSFTFTELGKASKPYASARA